MSATEPAKRGSRRTKAVKEEAVDSTPEQSMEAETAMVEKENKEAEISEAKATTAEESKPNGRPEVTALSLPVKDEKQAESSAIEVSPMGSIWNRPIAPAEVDVVESISVAGVRPIAASNMEIYGTILNNRPIMASNIRVAEHNVLADRRPIFCSDLVFRDDLTLPGGRPIVASDPRLLEASLLPGGRPIASNEIDDPETLMGFLD